MNKNLANLLLTYRPKIDALVRQLRKPNISTKDDFSPVTELDIALSELIEDLWQAEYPHTVFYSEEKFSQWGFPLMALDPIDGTREFIHGRPEWAVSIGLFQDLKFQGEGWVYNPATGELFEHGEKRDFVSKDSYIGEVSRSEYEQGLYQGKDVRPMGSIAYKLGRLSAHKCDFVVSLRPKNIWDIAGGTLLCMESGYKFYSQGKEVTTVEKTYLPPLLWCRPELFDELAGIFKDA